MGFLNRLVMIEESQEVKEKMQKRKQYQRIAWRGNEGDAQRSGKSGFNEKTEILIGKEKQKNPAPHQMKIFFASSNYSNNITTNKGSIFSLLKIVISAG
jgi:hypothetical protein